MSNAEARRPVATGDRPMRRPGSSRLAWTVPVLTTALVAVTLPMSRATAEHDVADVMFGLAFVGYAIVGALIASRHPGNPVGWLAAALGLVSAFGETLYFFAVRADLSPGPPGVPVSAAAWVATWLGGPSLVLLVLLLLVFPDGHAPSRRWRVVGVAAGVLALVWSVALALRPGPLIDASAVQNPVGVDSLREGLDTVEQVASSGLVVLLVVAAASILVRYRTSGAAQRQQIKWLVFAVGFGILMVLVVGVLALVADVEGGVGDLVTGLLIWCALVAFPVAVGIAVLRYRLYDIDLVINRTLVYGALTATLVGFYLASVLVFRFVLSPLTGESDLAVAGSTLAVAGLFRPVRSRIQSVVDRRFYRARYDAARTLEGFSARLRDELDIETLDCDLRRVVDDTMTPTRVSLWLRAPS